MINWESILPKNKELHECNGWSDMVAENSMRAECLRRLKAAESRGEICKPLSVEEIEDIQHDVIMCRGLSCKYCGVDRMRISRASHRIYNAMLGKEG